MNKQEFLISLRKNLSGLPQNDIEERLTFYSEMIDDRIEDGLSEEEAIFEIGNVDDITKQIIADIPFTKLAKEKIRPKRRLKAWEIVLIILGFPVWLPLLISAFAVILSVYIVLWALIISLWAIFGSFFACATGFIAGGIILAFCKNIPIGLILISAGLICASLTIFIFFGCKGATKGILKLTKKLALWIKGFFIKKEDSK